MYDIDEIRIALQERYFDKKILIQDIVKNNGVVLKGVSIKSDDSALAPVFYLDDHETTSSAVERIIATYEETNDVCFDTNSILRYEDVKDLLTLILVNKEMNIDILDNYIGEDFCDLRTIVTVYLEGIGGTIKVTKDLVKAWGVSEETVIADARHGLLSQKSIIMGLGDMLEEIVDEDMADIPIYVMTNKSKTYGANRLLDEEALYLFSEIHNSDIIIIPSSTHELLLVPEALQNAGDIEYINNMIQSVNMTEVDEKDILADHAYYYSSSTRQISILE